MEERLYIVISTIKMLTFQDCFNRNQIPCIILLLVYPYGKSIIVFIDEFDAFYHYELSESVQKRLRRISDVQVFTTTHNTDLMSNDLLRPDCYFLLENNSINAISELTEKELRQAHNLQKMYKAGAFNGR